MQIIQPTSNPIPTIGGTDTVNDTKATATDAQSGASRTQRHQQLVEDVLDYTEDLVFQPHVYEAPTQSEERCFRTYANYDINPDAYPRLEQGEALQLRLEGDVLYTAAQCQPFDLATCNSLLQGLKAQESVAARMADAKGQLLKLLQEFSDIVFQQFALDGRRDGPPVALSPKVRDALKGHGIELADTASLVQVYAGIAERWFELEKSLVQESLLALSLKLQVLRLSFYRSAGICVSELAQTLRSNHLKEEEWLEPGDVHLGGALLKSCVEDPFLSRWPTVDVRLPHDEAVERQPDN